MKIIILGGGLSGITTAYFLQQYDEVDEIHIIEKEPEIGGLCRSLHKDSYVYDIGPHILFSKDKEILNMMLEIIPAYNDLKRSNKILYKKCHVQYPFENDLSKLSKEDLSYCVTSFTNNPYRQYNIQNMLQFFLKTFGEGITNTYLRPYNEKIWKFDPSFMDMQMVERIPQPTDEEIMRSAAGETVDGYTHQLYFHYPSEGGIETVVKGFYNKLGTKCKTHLNQSVKHIEREGRTFYAMTDDKEYYADLIISTIPVPDFVEAYIAAPQEIRDCASDLKYNSIIIAFVKTQKDLCGDNFAFMIPERDVIFHRISKMDFLGRNYQSLSATYMIEITYRNGDYIDGLEEEKLRKAIAIGLIKIGFAMSDKDIEIINVTRHKYAYVIYDLRHKHNMDMIRNYFAGENVYLNGRFGNFEYWNMDKVVRESLTLSSSIISTGFFGTYKC